MPAKREIIAVIFDFDGTVIPDSITQLLEKYSVSASRFWKITEKQRELGYDQVIAYLNLLLSFIGKGKRLGPLTNGDLKKFGASIQASLYPRLDNLVSDLKRQVNIEQFENIDIEFYMISSGLQPIMEGIKFLTSNFTAIYGSELGGDPKTGVLNHIKKSINFTEKIRYLFEINKGIKCKDSAVNPFLVNKYVPDAERRVDWENMIFIGDGLTDIPCFSLVAKGRGIALGVDPKGTYPKFEGRTFGVYAPKYGKKDDLGALIRSAVTHKCEQIKLKQHSYNR